MLRQGQDDMNQWPQAAAIPLLFPSAWPSGSEDGSGSGGIYPFSLRIGSRVSVCVCVCMVNKRRVSKVLGALSYMICHSCLGLFSPFSILPSSETGQIWAFGLWHYGGGISPGRMPDSWSGEWRELCGALPGWRLCPLSLGSRQGLFLSPYHAQD